LGLPFNIENIAIKIIDKNEFSSIINYLSLNYTRSL
jgi:hypothetical protein